MGDSRVVRGGTIARRSRCDSSVWPALIFGGDAIEAAPGVGQGEKLFDCGFCRHIQGNGREINGLVKKIGHLKIDFRAGRRAGIVYTR